MEREKLLRSFLDERALSIRDLNEYALAAIQREAELFETENIEWMLRSILGKTSNESLVNEEILGFCRDGIVSPTIMLYQCVLRPGDLKHSQRLKKDLPIRAVNRAYAPLVGGAIVEQFVNELNQKYDLQTIIAKYKRQGKKLAVIGKGHGGLILGVLVAERLKLPFLPLTKTPFDFKNTGNKFWIHPEEPHLPKDSPILLSNMLIEPNIGVIIIDDEATSGSVHRNTIIELRRHNVTTELVAVLLKASDRSKAEMEKLGVPLYFMSESETNDDEPLTHPEFIHFCDLPISKESFEAGEDQIHDVQFLEYPLKDVDGYFLDHSLRGMTMELEPTHFNGAKRLAKEKLGNIVDLKKARHEANERGRSLFVVGTTPSGLHTALAVSIATNLPLVASSTRPEPIGIEDVVNYIGLDGYTYSIFGLTPGDSVVLITGELSDGEEQRRIIKALRDSEVRIVAHASTLENTRYSGKKVLHDLDVPSTTLFKKHFRENISTLNTTKKARACLVYALDNLSREIKRISPKGRIKEVKALPSSFTRGVMMSASDIDEIYIFAEGISQADLDRIYPRFLKWIEREGANYVDDHSNAPILISEEERENQIRKYCVNELFLIDLMREQFIKSMEEIAVESNKEISMFLYEKTAARIKLLLCFGEIEEGFVRKLLEPEHSNSAPYKDLLAFLESYRTHPLSKSAREFALKLDDIYVAGKYAYLVANLEQFAEDWRELYAAGLVRSFGTKILPIWRMHSGRVSRRFWERQIQVVIEGEPETFLIEGMSRLSNTDRALDLNTLSTELNSADPFNRERVLRTLIEEDRTVTEDIVEDVLNILDQSSTLVSIAAAELMMKYPDLFFQSIERRILKRIPMNTETAFTYQERLSLSWLVTILMRMAQTSVARATEVGRFVYDRFIKGQERDAHSLPHLVMQNIIENLPSVLPLIKDDVLKQDLKEALGQMSKSFSLRISSKAKSSIASIKANGGEFKAVAQSHKAFLMLHPEREAERLRDIVGGRRHF
jgi:adenine/guanine phosphoribosyltransferase-like PRPP-binding protein